MAVGQEFCTLFNLRRYWKRFLGIYLGFGLLLTIFGQEKPIYSHKFSDGSKLLLDKVTFGTRHYCITPRPIIFYLPPFQAKYQPKAVGWFYAPKNYEAYFGLRALP